MESTEREGRDLCPIILAGLGYTTRRLARRLLVRGGMVYGAARGPERFRALEAIGLRVRDFAIHGLPRHATIVHTIPPPDSTDRQSLRAFIRDLQPRRIIYISSTSVYGDQVEVDETTEPRPAGEKGEARFEEEQWLLSGKWRNLAVRPAAIYGPGRGVHESIRQGKLPRGAGSGVVSRVHVDDLAAILEAAVYSELQGAWPVADEHPCSSEEVIGFCGRLMKQEPALEIPRPFQAAGRKVDGRKIRELLGVSFLYPTYESGILASLAFSST